MKLEDFINTLNNHIENKRKTLHIENISKLVVHRVTTTTKINAIKDIKCSIWIVGLNMKNLLITISRTSRIVTDSEREKAILEVDKQVVSKLFELIDSDDFNKIVKGEYYGNE